MNDVGPQARRSFILSLFATVLAGTLPAATYLPLSDTDLARRSPVIVRARVDSQTVGLERINGNPFVMTAVEFEWLETIKGRVSGETFRVRLPGGRAGNTVSWVSGTPSFQEGEEVLLFLRPAPGHPGDFCLSELGLSRFDIRTDAEGRRFALRPAFPPEEDDYLSMRTPAIAPVGAGTVPLRKADSFQAALKTIARGQKASKIDYSEPRGRLTDGRGQIRPLWVNIKGPEGGRLVRWFWDTGVSPNGVVAIAGTQSSPTLRMAPPTFRTR